MFIYLFIVFALTYSIIISSKNITPFIVVSDKIR